MEKKEKTKQELIKKISQLTKELAPKLNCQNEESVIVLANIKDNEGKCDLTSLAQGKVFDLATVMIYLIQNNPSLDKLFTHIYEKKLNINKKNK